MTGMAASVQAILFPTAIGSCAIAWRGEAVVATHLPEASEDATWAQLARRAGALEAAAPPPEIDRGIAAITTLLAGQRTDLGFIVLEMAQLDAFRQGVYRQARAIPPGETRSYGQIADALGGRHLSQSVGKALGRNPFPIIVPCHRVMGADGRLTGFSAEGGIATKLKMLEIERASIGTTPSLFETLPLAVKPPRGA